MTSKLQEKPSALQRDHPALQKLKFTNCFIFFWVIFALLDPETPIRIRIQSGSGSATLKESQIQGHLQTANGPEPSFFIHVTLDIHQLLKKNGAKKRLTAKSASRRRSESAGLGSRRQKFCRMRKVHSSPVYIPMYFTLHSKFTYSTLAVS
jgi:hypothetical protein